LWLMLKVNGAARVRDAIERCIGLAEHAERLLESDPSWEVVTPAQLGIVTFARRDWSGEEHSTRAADLAADGFAAVTSTVLRDRPVLRLCTINPLTTETDIEQTLWRLAGAEM